MADPETIPPLGAPSPEDRGLKLKLKDRDEGEVEDEEEIESRVVSEAKEGRELTTLAKLFSRFGDEDQLVENMRVKTLGLRILLR